MHEKQAKPNKKRASMIRDHSHKQLPLAEFDWPFQTALDENNRWVKMSACIPWDELAEETTQLSSKSTQSLSGGCQTQAAWRKGQASWDQAAVAVFTWVI